MTTAHGSMEVESVACMRHHSSFCQHAVPQQFSSMFTCHQVSVTCVSVVRILFEGSSLSTGNRADFIRGWILFDVWILLEEIQYIWNN